MKLKRTRSPNWRFCQRCDFLRDMFKGPTRPSLIHRGHVRLVDCEPSLIASFTVNDETHVINFVMVLKRSVYRNYFNVHQQRKHVRGNVIWLLRTSRLIPEIGICLSFQKSFGESTGRLVKTDHHDAILFIKSFASDSSYLLYLHASPNQSPD